MITNETMRENVLHLLLTNEWVSTVEINAVGGTEGTRRLRELRAEGYTIEKKHTGERQYVYRLVL